MIKSKIRSLNLWACIVLASLILSLVMSSTCLAASSDLKSKFNDNEYQTQLHNLTIELNKIKDDVKNGKISQEKANGTIKSFIDDPRYNQVKIKKQIVEQEYEVYVNKKPDLTPNSPEFKKLKLDPDKTLSTALSTASSSTTSSTTYNYWYTDLSYETGSHNGWGVGYSIANLDYINKAMKIASRAESLGSYYSLGHFYRNFYAPRSGNAVVRADIEWTGGCLSPDVCSIDFVLLKYVSGAWVQVNSNNIVSITGVTLTNGPNAAHTSFTANLQNGGYYCFDVRVNTKASTATIVAGTVADFGFPAIGGTPMVKYKQSKLTYY